MHRVCSHADITREREKTVPLAQGRILEVGIGSGENQGTSVIPGEFALYSYPTTASIAFGVDIKF